MSGVSHAAQCHYTVSGMWTRGSLASYGEEALKANGDNREVAEVGLLTRLANQKPTEKHVQRVAIAKTNASHHRPPDRIIIVASYVPLRAFKAGLPISRRVLTQAYTLLHV